MKEDIDLEKFGKLLNNESDRGVVLISAELIHNYLAKLLEKGLILNSKLRKDIFENSVAPLHTFYSKIKMAYSLGLIDKKHYNNLECIREIRNKFAHRIFDASFDDDEIIKCCKKINIVRIPSYEPSKYVVGELGLPSFAANPLVARAFASSLEAEKSQILFET